MKKATILKVIGVVVALWLLFKVYELTTSRNSDFEIDLSANSFAAFNKRQMGNVHLKERTGKYATYVHLDLKGAPPKLEYLSKLFSFFELTGARGVLVEYEDMFPYDGKLSAIRAKNHYSKAQISEIIDMATKRNLDIIPLVQTFGHLEFLLEKPDFQSLREVANDPCCLNAAKSDAAEIVFEMVNQVLLMHPLSSAIHIGCDEVFNMGQSKESKDLMKEQSLSKHDLYFRHVIKVADRIRTHKSHVKVIVWDDMMRGISREELKKSKIGDYVEPMLWCYLPNVNSQFPRNVLENFASVFRRVWIASAFKGATGSDQIYTDANFHVSNHESWLRLISSVEQAGKPLTIAGWALTGWSRYTHLMALCEIMPIAMPSLAVCMWTLGATQDNLGKLLNCSGVVNVGDDSALGQCGFVGSQIYGDIVLLRNVHNAYRSRILGSMRSVSEVMAAKPSKEMLEFADVQLKTIKLIENRLAVAMRELFFDDTVDEWFQTHVARIKADLTRMVSI